jgi:cytochrome c5
MGTALLRTHLVSVILFLLIYLIKTFLLVANKNEALAKFVKVTKVPEMIISVLFLGTGIYLLTAVGASKLIIIKIGLVLTSIPLAIIGFKKGNKVLAVISLLLIIGAYALAEVNKKRVEKKDIEVPTSELNSTSAEKANYGKQVYSAYCEKCHGTDGTNGSMGLDLTVTQFDHAAIAERITNGAGSMPPFKDVLNAQELDAVVAFVETLKK